MGLCRHRISRIWVCLLDNKDLGNDLPEPGIAVAFSGFGIVERNTDFADLVIIRLL